MASNSAHTLGSISAGFTYKLQQRMSAGNLAHIHYFSSRAASLTNYSSGS